MQTTYKSTGLVFGNYWGGGKGAYKAKNLIANTKEDLLTKANIMLKDGSLDSGMGYDSLIGAILLITEITTIYINKVDFSHEEYITEFIGDLTEDDKEFLLNCEY